MTAPVNHLDKLAIVQIDFDIWSGQVKLDNPDIKLGAGGELPPKDLVELGRKYVIGREHLKSFSRLKTKARRLCLSHGMTFMNGFAVPINRVDQICAELDKVADEMNHLKANFLSNYDQWIQDWQAKNPDYAQAIRSGVLTKDIVKKRLGFDYQVFQVNPVSETESNKLNSMASGLTGELMDEIVSESDDFFHKSLKGKDSCSLITQKTLKRIRDKVDGLSFLDSRFLSIVKLLNQTIKGYPETGPVRGEQFYKILSAALILSSHDKIKSYASGAVDVDSMANSFMLDGQDDAQTSLLAPVNVVSLDAVEQSSSTQEADIQGDDDIDSFFQKHAVEGNSSNAFF